MDAERKHLVRVSLVTAFLLVALMIAGGCKKSEEPATPPSVPDEPAAAMPSEAKAKEAVPDLQAKVKDIEAEAKDVAAAMPSKAEAEEIVKTFPVSIEQKTCPVMEGPINKEFFTEYKGQKVYFCCAECKGKFEQNPEQYIAKLPQFNK